MRFISTLCRLKNQLPYSGKDVNGHCRTIRLRKNNHLRLLARAMLKDAPVIILDEATASIDPENEHLIQQAISELTRGKTIITIAHRPATIQQADQILVVDDGRITECGTHEQLIEKDGVYKNFMEIRQRAEGWTIG